MDQETKSNIKMAAIALVIMTVVLGSLYKYNQAHEASHSHADGKEHSH